jgi:benzoyl-CoA reductase/2-hydroxyglutaryl-CoA dehydratase subunit BcrC/BadD/HgdB
MEQLVAELYERIKILETRIEASEIEHAHLETKQSQFEQIGRNTTTDSKMRESIDRWHESRRTIKG